MIKSKEVDIEALNVTTEEQKVKIGELKNAHLIEINDLKQKFNEKAENLLYENKALNEKIKELGEKIDLQEAFIQNTDNGVGNKAGCDKCDFLSTDQFTLLLHKSTKHATYILNSQPEAVTGPLH